MAGSHHLEDQAIAISWFLWAKEDFGKKYPGNTGFSMSQQLLWHSGHCRAIDTATQRGEWSSNNDLWLLEVTETCTDVMLLKPGQGMVSAMLKRRQHTYSETWGQKKRISIFIQMPSPSLLFSCKSFLKQEWNVLSHVNRKILGVSSHQVYLDKFPQTSHQYFSNSLPLFSLLLVSFPSTSSLQGSVG